MKYILSIKYITHIIYIFIWNKSIESKTLPSDTALEDQRKEEQNKNTNNESASESGSGDILSRNNYTYQFHKIYNMEF